MSAAELTGSGLLGSILLIGIAAINVQRHGIDGLLDRMADRKVRRAVWLQSAAEWYRLFRVQGPRVFREIHAEKGEALGIGAKR